MPDAKAYKILIPENKQVKKRGPVVIEDLFNKWSLELETGRSKSVGSSGALYP